MRNNKLISTYSLISQENRRKSGDITYPLGRNAKGVGNKNMKKRQYSQKAEIKKDNQSPVKKISETLLDFAHPLIEMIDGSTTEQDIKNRLILPITVWNSLVLEIVQNNPLHLEKLRNSILESDNPQGCMIMESLI